MLRGEVIPRCPQWSFANQDGAAGSWMAADDTLLDPPPPTTSYALGFLDDDSEIEVLTQYSFVW